MVEGSQQKKATAGVSSMAPKTVYKVKYINQRAAEMTHHKDVDN